MTFIRRVAKYDKFHSQNTGNLRKELGTCFSKQHIVQVNINFKVFINVHIAIKGFDSINV